MADQNRYPDNDRTEFDSIVARLRAGELRRAADANPPGTGMPPQRSSNGRFCAGCLAIIFPLSLVVGGWMGIVATVVALVVTLRLVIEETTP